MKCLRECSVILGARHRPLGPLPSWLSRSSRHQTNVRTGKTKQVLSALLQRLADEESLSVTERIVNAVTAFGQEALPEAIDANKRAAVGFVRASGRYTGIALSLQLNHGASRSEVLQGLTTFVTSIEFPGEFDRTPGFFAGPSYLLDSRLRVLLNREITIYTGKPDQSVVLLADRPKALPDAAVRVAQQWRYFRATSLVLVQFIRSMSGGLNQWDFSATALCCANFSNLDLRGINFQRAILFEISADSADLRCADLDRADLQGTWLGHVKLSGANIAGAALPDFESYDKEKRPDFSGTNWWESAWLGNGPFPRRPVWLEREFPQAKEEPQLAGARTRCFDK